MAKVKLFLYICGMKNKIIFLVFMVTLISCRDSEPKQYYKPHYLNDSSDVQVIIIGDMVYYL